AKACAEPLFRMRATGQNGDDQPLGLWSDRRGPTPEACRRPLRVSTVGTGHMLGVGAVTASAIATLMNGDAPAAVEYLDHPGRGADVDLLADKAVRHGIEEGLELDMIVGGDPSQAPFGELVILHWQARQGRPF